MPNLTPQQKLLETLYRKQSAQRTSTLEQKKVQRSYNKPSGATTAEAGKIKGSKSIQAQSKIRSYKKAKAAEASRFSRQVKSAAGTAKAKAAVNISKFGGGAKTRLAPTLGALKTVAVKQGVKAATLRGALANSKFLAGTPALPLILLLAGNEALWRRNIKTLKSIYNHKDPYIITHWDLINTTSPPSPIYPFTGGQDENGVYNIHFKFLIKYTYSDEPRELSYVFNSIRGKILNIEVRESNDRITATIYTSHRELPYYTQLARTSSTSSYVENSVTIQLVRSDGQPDIGNPQPVENNEPLKKGNGNKNVPVATPTQVQTNNPATTVKPPTTKPSKEKEEQKAPVIIPPLPTQDNSDFVKLPSYIRGGLPIVTSNPTPNDTAKKPSSSVKKTYYPNQGETPDEAKARVAKLRGRIDEIKKENSEEVSTVPTLPFLPLPGRVENPGTTTKLKGKPSPSPIPTKVNPCKKGCGGSSGGISSGSSPTESGLEAANNALLLKIDATTTRTRDVITDPKFGLAKVQNYAETAWKATKADKIVNALNTMLIIHNGFMLSNNMLNTVSEVAEVGLEVLGIRDEEDSPIDISRAIGSKIKSLLENTLGSSRYEELTKDLASKMRIYQSGANMLYNIRSIFDSAQDIAETTGENIAFIGNALRRDGVVRENSYRLMPTDLQPSSRLLYRLERANDALDTIEEVISDARDIKEELNEMQDNAKTFNEEVEKATTKQQKAIDEAKFTVTSSRSVPEPSEVDEERGVENGK